MLANRQKDETGEQKPGDLHTSNLNQKDELNSGVVEVLNPIFDSKEFFNEF